MKMDRITTQYSFLSEVSEARIADAAAAELMIKRVSAHPVRIGTFHNDITREVGDLAPQLSAAIVFEFERPIEADRRAFDLRNDALLGLGRGRVLLTLPVRPQ